MLLVIDVGNTNTKLGVYAGSRLAASWRIASRRDQTVDEYGVLAHTLFRGRAIDPAAVDGVAISSTVPAVQPTLAEVALRYFGVRPLVVEPGVNVPVPILVDHPREVGPDRLVKVVAAVELYTPPLIIVDCGTATTFECVSAKGEFVGGAIAPGLQTAAEALMTRAARLFQVELARPARAIGTNTTTNIQSGIIYGYAGLVDGLVARMRAELEGDATVVATGGLADLLREVSHVIQIVDPHLTLEGLRLLWERSHRSEMPPARQARAAP